MATSATVLHYGVSVHDGISVVQNANTNKLQAFRAKEHMTDFIRSSKHLDLPTFAGKELMDCIKQLVQLDKDWLDVVSEGDQFYTRMVHFSTDSTLGVRTP